MANAVEVSKPTLPHMASVERIYKLPVVEQTVDLATNLYGRVKEVNPIVNTVLSTAETTVRGAVDKTIPVANRLERPLKVVDSLLCSSLDFVENNLPVVKLPPEEMYENTRDFVLALPGVNCACQLGQQGVRKAVECACAVSEYSTLKLNILKETLAAQDSATTPDAGTLLTMYIYTVLNVLAAMSSWVGLGQGAKANDNDTPTQIKHKHHKNKANGNTASHKYTPEKEESQPEHNCDQQ